MRINKICSLIILLVFVMSLLPAANCFAADVSLTSRAECAPYSIFQKSENVAYTVNGATEGRYSVTDFFGNRNSGTFSSGEIVIPNLDVGYYDLEVTAGAKTLKTEFAVVTDLKDRRDSSYNPLAFSAMATYTYTTNNVENYDAYAKTISLAGVNYVREFINWKDLMTDSRHLKKNEKLINAYNDNNIGVMLMIQDMPGENARNTDYYEKGNCITYDLNKAYNAIKKMLDLYDGKIDAIEFLNEPDDMTEMDTADRYASLLKVASIAAGDINENIKISSAGIAKSNSTFSQRLLQNDIDSYIDIYDTHFYNNYSSDKIYVETPEGIDNFMGDAVAYGMSNKRLWMSEYGFRSKFNNTADADLSDSQLVQTARTAPLALLRANKSGVDKMFWFIHGYLKEDGINGYGTLRSTHTPTQVYSALSAFTNALGNAGYSREFEVGGANVCIYSDGTEEIACVWSEDDRNITLPVNNGQVIITDIMGREMLENVENSSIEINAGPDVQYIRALNGFSDGSIETVKYEKENSRSLFTVAEKVVMTPSFEDDASVMAASRAYSLVTSGEKSNEVNLNIYNFNDSPVNVNVNCLSQGGWTVENPEQNVTVPAKTNGSNGVEGGFVTLTFSVKGNENADIYSNTPLVFSAMVDGEGPIETVTYITSKEINYTPIDGGNSCENWSVQSKGNENNTIASYLASSNSGIKMSCEFNSSTKNKACRINFKKSIALDTNSKGLSFKCTSPQEPETMLRLWMTDSDSDTFYSSYTVGLKDITGDGNDYVYVFPFEDFKWGYGTGNKILDVGNVNIKVGIMNPTVDLAEYCFRDFGVVQSRENEESEICVNRISYKDGLLTAQLSSADAKDVKFMILGKVFDGSVFGNTARANALLPEGTYDVEIFVYDMANKVHKDMGNITVLETDEPDVTTNSEKQGAFVDQTGRVSVKGRVDRIHGGKTATLIVYPDSIDAENVTISDLVYVDEIKIANSGDYIFEFDIKNYDSEKGYTYTLNLDGEPIYSKLGEYELVYEWSGVKIEFFRTEKNLRIVSAMNFAPENISFITGMYDKSGNLIQAFSEGISKCDVIQKNEFEYNIPSGTRLIKAIIWSDDGNIIPLQLPYVGYCK